MNYCYGKGDQNCVLCWKIVPFSEGPLSEVLLYTLNGKQHNTEKRKPENTFFIVLKQFNVSSYSLQENHSHAEDPYNYC